MKEQSIILYSRTSLNPAPGYAPVLIDGAMVCLVRAEVYYGNIEEALANAKPRPDEIVLNTVPRPTFKP